MFGFLKYFIYLCNVINFKCYDKGLQIQINPKSRAN